MWRDEKTEYLRKNRDYSRLLDGDDAEVQTPRSQNRGRSKEGQVRADDDDDDDDVSPERQEYLNRRRRLKELERQKLIKGKNGLRGSSSRDEVPKPAEPIKDQGGSSGGGGALPLFKEKNKMPYRSFGSFFGPSEPVVAKRIIEEARAREQAEIVAAREANSRREKKAEQKKSVAALPAGKSVRDSGPSRLPQPVDKATEKARKLKEARDYSFLFDDSPLPGLKWAEREGPASSILREARHGTSPGKANDHPPRKVPLELPKITIRARRPDESTTPSRSFQSQSKSSEPSRSVPRHGSNSRYDPGRSDIRHLSIVDRSTKPLTSKISSAGPGRPDPRKEKDLEKAIRREFVAGSTSNRNKNINGRLAPRKEKDLERALMREVVAGSASNRNKSSNVDRRPQPSPVLERRSSQTLDRRPTLLKERALNKPLHMSPSLATERQPAQTTDRRPTLVIDREIVMAKASERGASIVQGSKRGAPTSAAFRATAVREEQRRHVLVSQKLERKPTSTSALEPSVSDYPRRRYSEEPGIGETRRKRAPSLSDDDDDSFIDDHDDPGNVSSMIHSIMGYNPNKYRGNDDFDDRSMEVGFRHIQAEERRSAREARFEDERELAMIEAEERKERLRKAKKKRKQVDR